MYTWHLPSPGTALRALLESPHLGLASAHCAEEETEAWRSEVLWPKTPSSQVVLLRSEPECVVDSTGHRGWHMVGAQYVETTTVLTNCPQAKRGPPVDSGGTGEGASESLVPSAPHDSGHHYL